MNLLKNKKGDILIVVLILIWFIGTICFIYDSVYCQPKASETANNYCEEKGFDQYKSYSRIGIFSKNPVGIKCEYAERYTDLGVRTNSQSPN